MKELSIEDKAKAYDEIIFLIEKQNGIILEDAILDSNEDGLIADTIRYKKQTEQKPILDFNADDWYTSKVDGKIHNAKLDNETPSCVQIKKQGEHKPAWSEEDEKMFEYALSMIEWYGGVDEDKSKPVSDWLKSLKERYIWKPTDLQIEALESATENCAYSEYQGCLRVLIAQLKKLKGGTLGSQVMSR